MPIYKPVPIPIPFGGLHTQSAFEDQPPGTTPHVLNMRPFDSVDSRRRLARRPTLEKQIPDRLADGSVQDLGAVILAIDEISGTGDVITVVQGVSDANAVVYANDKTTDPNASEILFTSTALLGARSMGTTDEDNYFYVANVASSGTSINIRKISTDYVEKWNATLSLGDQCNIFGIAAFEHVVYLYAVPLATGDTITEGIYRFNADNGERLDPGVWIGTGQGLGTVIDVATAHQNIAASAGRVAVVCKSGSNLVLQQIDIETSKITSTATIESFNSYQSKCITDEGGNFYVLSNVTGAAVNKCVKINSAGATPSAFTNFTSATKTATDIHAAMRMAFIRLPR